MHLQLIRNATLRVTYAGHLFVIDPYLAPKHALDPIAGKSRNPTVDLPCTPQEAIAGAEMVIVSHLHRDHFDAAAQEILPKDILLYCQPGDQDKIAEKGFANVQVILDSTRWQGIQITRTPAQHGTGVWAERMGSVSGFVFRAAGEPTVYWPGDTIWYAAVEQAIAQHAPDIIITHSCGAQIQGSGPIVFDAQQTIAVCRAAPKAVVVAVHMEALDHATVSRADLRASADSQGISAARLRIPADGETLEL